MILTPDFMKTMGVGNDPTDLLCQAGYDYFVGHFPDPVRLKVCLREFQAQIEAGEVDRGHGAAWLQWLLALRQNAKAIIEGGEFERLDQYVAYGPSGTYRTNSRADVMQKVDAFLNNSRSVERIQIVAFKQTRAGHKMKTVKKWHGGFRHALFDPATGRWHEVSDEAEGKALYQSIRHRLMQRERKKIRISRRVRDTAENFYAWEDITP